MSLRPTPHTSAEPDLRDDLELLRAELADLAFTLERRGRLDAADVVISISSRLDVLCAKADHRLRGTPPARHPVRDDTPRSL